MCDWAAPFRRPSACARQAREVTDKTIIFGRRSMRGLILAAVSIVVAAFSPAAHAEDAPAGVKGIFLMADFPSGTIRPGATSPGSLQLQNLGLPPPSVNLAV